MKKSKFLKKSLATLLALMLVVAMIPVGASAAAVPDIAAVKVTVNGSATLVPIESGSKFSADIPEGTAEVAVTADEIGSSTLTYTNKDGDQLSADKIDLKNELTAENGVYTIPLTLTCADGDHSNAYTLVLTEKAAATTTNLKSVTPTANTGIIDTKFDNDKKTVTLTVPFGYTNEGTVTLVTADGASVSNDTLSSIDDATTFVVTSASTGNASSWKVVLNRVNVLTAFKAGDVAAEINIDPNGDGNYNDAEVKASYSASILLDKDGNPAAKVELDTLFTPAYAGSTVKLGNTKITSGKAIDYKAYFNDSNKTMDVVCEGVTSTYAFKLSTEKDSAKDIVSAQVNGFDATVAYPKISVDLPAETNLESVQLSFTTAKTVTSVKVGNTEINDPTVAEDTKTWTTTTDIKKGITVTVTAEDGTTKQYVLTATATQNPEEAALATMTLESPEGEQIVGKVTDRTVTFEKVPYMTKDMSGWKVFFTVDPSNATKLYKGTNTGNVLTSGITTLANIDNAFADISKDGLTVSNAVSAISVADTSIKTTYSISIKLAGYSTGKTIKSVSATSATGADVKAKYNAMADENTYAAKVDNTNKKITITTSWSDKDAALTVSALATDNGAVAFIGTKGADGTYTVTPVDALKYNEKTKVYTDGTEVDTSKVIIVLSERYARDVDASIDADTAKLGTVYTIERKNNEAATGSSMTSLKVGDVSFSINGQKLNVTLPYSMTVASDETLSEDNTYFPEFVLSKLAGLTDAEGSVYVSGGKKDADGKVMACGTDNAKLYFVRQNDGTLKVYRINQPLENAGMLATKHGNQLSSLKVIAEAGVNNYSTYSFDKVKYNPANTEAKLNSLKLNNTAASISGATVTAVMPYKTSLTNITLSYTASAGATVKVNGVKVVSGETVVNCSKDVILEVTSEDGLKTVKYTLKTTVADQFTDVKTTDWFYNEVMTAAANGWVDGTGNGKFSPYSGMKRGDFAKIIAAIDNADLSKYTESAFPDVPSDKYYSAAVAYCADKGYIGGDEKGYFNGEKMITREEAAKIMCNVKGLTQVTEPTTKFADDAKIQNWAKGYVYACKEAKIFGGDEKNCFNPGDTMQRCEGAAILVRAFA